MTEAQWYWFWVGYRRGALQALYCWAVIGYCWLLWEISKVVVP
jgi:hypothetical protein